MQGQRHLVTLLDEVHQLGIDTKEGAEALQRLDAELKKQAKRNKPKGLRISEREPYYVKLTKPKRR